MTVTDLPVGRIVIDIHAVAHLESVDKPGYTICGQPIGMETHASRTSACWECIVSRAEIDIQPPTPTPKKANAKRNSEGMPWEIVYERVRRERPSVADCLLWPREMPLMGLMQFIGDLGTVSRTWGIGTNSTGNSGARRRQHEPEVIAEGIREIFYEGCGVGMGPRIKEDYTNEPFVDAMRYMVGQRTAEQMARRTGIQEHRIRRLLKGSQRPTGSDMETIARTFSKKPWYFREYRVTMIAAYVIDQLELDPDSAAVIARQIAS